MLDQSRIEVLNDQYNKLVKQNLSLDLTRGKPSSAQLDLSNDLDGILKGEYKSKAGVDSRNYGGLDGLAETKEMGAKLLGVDETETLVGGNSSLTLMYQYLMNANFFGLDEKGPWKDQSKDSECVFLCPTPGYDRHFTICEDLGIRMVAVPFTDEGPDLDVVKSLIKEIPLVKGMWCVPKYSNPTGHVYSKKVVQGLAEIIKEADSDFRLMWDNAYAVHDLNANAPELANIMDACREFSTEDKVIITASSSKITFAGAGISFLGATKNNISVFSKRLQALTIGPDKVNQLRHVKLFGDFDGLKKHMSKHAEIIKPKFDLVLKILDTLPKNIAEWSKPEGGYFISFNTKAGLADKVVKKAGLAGVKLTPAGATFPYKQDPQNQNIRIAPTLPTLGELQTAMEVFILCVELCTLEEGA